jgi:hypothetical protein
MLLAILLHTYENWPREDAPVTWGWWLWSLLPYGVFLVTFRTAGSGLPSIAAASASLALDCWIHYSVFVVPSGSTAALALIFVPIWNTLLIGPAVMLPVWFLVRRRRAHADAL